LGSGIYSISDEKSNVEEAYQMHKNASEMVSNPSTEAKLFVENFYQKAGIKVFPFPVLLHF
jgi:LAO/AO transport system kinase